VAARRRIPSLDVAALAAIVESLPYAVSLWDADVRNVYANAACGAWINAEPDAVHGHLLSEFITEDAMARLRPVLDAALGGAPQLVDRAGTGRAYASYSPNTVDGQVRGVVAFAADVSDRAAAELAVRRNTEQAAIFDLRQSVAAELDRRAIAQLDASVAELHQTLQAPSDADVERIDRAADGIDTTIVELRAAVKNLRREDPMPAGVWDLASSRLGIGTESTSRVIRRGATDGALAVAAAAPGVRGPLSGRLASWSAPDLAALLDHVPAVLCHWSDSLECLFANRTAVIAFGRSSRDDVVGRTAKELLGAEAFAANRPYARTALEGTPTRFERSLIERGGVMRYTQAYYAPTPAPGGNAGLVTLFVETTAQSERDSAIWDEVAGDVLHRERLRIAEDLHDLVIQRLFAAALAAQSAQRASGSERIRWVRMTGDSIDNAIAELRTSIYNLKGLTDTADLPMSVARVAHQAAMALGFAPAITYIGSPRNAPWAVSGELLAVLTEALSNVARHAGASRVDVTISTRDQEMNLVVADDGRGMGTPATSSGLANMQARAQRLGGSFRCYPNNPAGTVIDWRAPV
jgi:signal transduction histidine kinase